MNLSLRGSVASVLVAAVVLMMSAFAEAQDINDTLMRKQADSFLFAMPDSMQYHQAKSNPLCCSILLSLHIRTVRIHGKSSVKDMPLIRV